MKVIFKAVLVIFLLLVVLPFGGLWLMDFADRDKVFACNELGLEGRESLARNVLIAEIELRQAEGQLNSVRANEVVFQTEDLIGRRRGLDIHGYEYELSNRYGVWVIVYPNCSTEVLSLDFIE